MYDEKFITIVEDSRQKKYAFFYKNQSIICKEINKNNIYKETTLISQVSSDFQAAVDYEDIVYLVCNNRDKGVIVLIYERDTWKLQQILNVQNSTNLYLLKAYAIKKSLHIIYARKLPVANFYNIHHIFSNSISNPSSWKKSNVTEVFSEDLINSISFALTKDNLVHIANVWFDGSSYYIVYCCFDPAKELWIKKDITKLFDKGINVQLLTDRNKLHLFCHTNEDNSVVVFYFNKNEKSDFEFVSMNTVSTGIIPDLLFFIDNSKIFAAWLVNDSYCEIVLKDSQRDWSSIKEYKVEDTSILFQVEYILNTERHGIRSKCLYMLIDDNNSIMMPWQYKEVRSNPSNVGKTAAYPSTEANGDKELTTYIPYILEEIKSMSDSIKLMSSKIDSLYDSQEKKTLSKSSKNNSTTDISYSDKKYDIPQISSHPKKNTNFKERFLNNGISLNNPSATALFVANGGLPKANIPTASNEVHEATLKAEAVNVETEEEIEHTENEVAKVELPIESEQQPEDESGSSTDSDDAKQGKLIKKLGDLFK